MKKRQLNAISFLLILVLLVSTMWVATPSTVYAATTTPPDFTEEQIKIKLNKLCELLENKYFTTDQKAHSAGSDETVVRTIVKQSWVKSLFGTTYNAENFPKQYYVSSNGTCTAGTHMGSSCYGFANFVEYYLYSSKATDNLIGEKIFSGDATIANIKKYARTGDVLRFGPDGKGHSIVLISVISDTKIKVLHCNWGNQCKVTVEDIAISALKAYGKMAITRASNYAVNDNTTTDGVQVKIDQVMAEVNKEFTNGVFSVNGTDCYTGSNHACSNCNLYSILSNRLGENLSTWKSKTSDGDQCAAFAKYFFVKVFGSCKETTDRLNIGSGQSKSTYSTLKKGDLFFTANHWMIYLSHDSNGVSVIDANGSGDLKIRTTKYSYSSNNLSGSVTVWHSNHWDEVNNQSSGDSTTSKPSVSVCEEYWKVNDEQGVYLRKEAGTDAESYCLMPNNAQLYVTKKTTSKVDGYTWGYGTYKTYTGWFAIEYAERVYLPQTITCDVDAWSGVLGVSPNCILNAKTTGNGILNYISSNTDVATVNSSGEVSAVGVGTTTITINASATSTYSAASRKVVINVMAPEKSIQTIQCSDSYIKKVGDDAFNINATTTGDGSLNYVSSDTDVVVVDSTGKVTIVGEGVTTIIITASETDHYKSARAIVNIEVDPADVVEENIRLRVGKVDVSTGSIVRVPIYIENNVGVAYLALTVQYDANIMRLQKMENGDVFADSDLELSNLEKNPVTVLFACTELENNSHNGVIVYLEYAIDENTPEGIYDLSISSASANNVQEERIACIVEDGTITVSREIPGDVNSDGEIDGLDLVRLKKYLAGWDVIVSTRAANVNGDEQIDGLDLVRLKKYLAGWDVVLK